MARISVEVVSVRDYNLTENRFGTAKYPVCTRRGTRCSGVATQVVTIAKFGHNFPEVMCPECAEDFTPGDIVMPEVEATAYHKGIAAFFNTPVNEFMDLPDDDKRILQKFVDAYRKGDQATMAALVKDNKPLIKSFWDRRKQTDG